MLRFFIFLLFVLFFVSCSSNEEIQFYTASLEDAHSIRELMNSGQIEELEKRVSNFKMWEYNLKLKMECGKYKGMEIDKERVKHRFELGNGGVHEIWLTYEKGKDRPELWLLGW